MLCWFGGGLTDSFGGLERVTDGLALIEATACPHYGDERRRAFHRAIADGAGAGYAAEDGAALHFTGPSLAEVVSSRADAAAYRVEQAAGRVVETRLPVRFLGQTLSAGS
jgi:peptidase E